MPGDPRMTDLHCAVLGRFLSVRGGTAGMNSAEIAKELRVPEARIATIIAQALDWTRSARKRA